MSVEERLESLGYRLPQVVPPLASYVPAIKAGNSVYSSGQIPMVDGVLVWKGKLGADLSVEDGYDAARISVLNALAAVKNEIGDLNRITRVIRVTGYVNCTEQFTGQPAVINGASDLLQEVFGDAGKHSRAAVGVIQLPLGAAVEVDIIVEVAP